MWLLEALLETVEDTLVSVIKVAEITVDGFISVAPLIAAAGAGAVIHGGFGSIKPKAMTPIIKPLGAGDNIDFTKVNKDDQPVKSDPAWESLIEAGQRIQEAGSPTASLEKLGELNKQYQSMMEGTPSSADIGKITEAASKL